MKTKKNFFLEDDQIKRMKDRSAATGVPMSEIVRRGIDLYFEQIKRGLSNENKK
jgi:hypothetical protein